MRSTFLPVRQRPAIISSPMIIDDPFFSSVGGGKGDSSTTNQCVPFWTPSQMESLIRSGALPMPVPRTPVSLGGYGQNQLTQVQSQPSLGNPPPSTQVFAENPQPLSAPDLKTTPSADQSNATAKKSSSTSSSSSSEREISSTGLVMWGYDDFKIGPYRTGIRLSSSALSKPVSDKDRNRVYGHPWMSISRFDPRWVTLAKTNPLASNIYAKECGGGGRLYVSIHCVRTQHFIWE